MSVQVVSFKCILKNKTGKIISTTFNRDVITAIESSSEQILSGLAKGLQNLKAGEKRRIELAAGEAYGFYDPNKVILIPRKKITMKTLPNPGELVSITGKSGIVRTYRYVDSHGDYVALDANHPLAGQDLVFEIETLEVRDATADEIQDSNDNPSQKVIH